MDDEQKNEEATADPAETPAAGEETPAEEVGDDSAEASEEAPAA